jgi:hypothetical protein
MPGEQEELQLVVTLDDQASAKLAELKKQLTDLNSGFDRMGKGSEEASHGVKNMHKELESAVIKGTFFGNMMAEAGKKVGDFVGQIVDRVTDIRGFAQEMSNLSTAAYRMGTATAQLESNLRVFREAGVTSEAAARNLAGLSDSIADLATVNGQLRGSLLSGGFLETTKMLEGLQSIDSASTMGSKAEAIRKMAVSIREFWTARIGPEMGAKKERDFLGMFGASDIDQLRRIMKDVPQWQKDVIDQRNKAAGDFLEVSEKTVSAQEDIIKAHQAMIALAAGPLLSAWSKLWEGWAESLDRQAYMLQKMKEAADKAAPAPTWTESLNPFSQQNTARREAAEKERQRLMEDFKKKDEERAVEEEK